MLPRLSVVVAQGDALAVRFFPIAIRADERSRRMADEMGRRSVKSEGTHLRPALSPVGRLALHDRETYYSSVGNVSIIVILHPDMADEVSILEFDDVRFVIVSVLGSRVNRYRSELAPGRAGISAPHCHDATYLLPPIGGIHAEFFPEVDE